MVINGFALLSDESRFLKQYITLNNYYRYIVLCARIIDYQHNRWRLWDIKIRNVMATITRDII